jgi:transposase InsO family protein
MKAEEAKKIADQAIQNLTDALKSGKSERITQYLAMLAKFMPQVFDGRTDAKALAANRRLEYNHPRPHSSLKYLPPAVFAATLAVPSVRAAPLPTLS